MTSSFHDYLAIEWFAAAFANVTLTPAPSMADTIGA